MPLGLSQGAGLPPHEVPSPKREEGSRPRSLQRRETRSKSLAKDCTALSAAGRLAARSAESQEVVTARLCAGETSSHPSAQRVEAKRNGVWEVDTVKNGWKPLAPALQSALDTAMAMSVDRVEVLIDPVSRTWYMDVASADDEVRQRCTWYVVFPRRQEMGKIDGAPPRSVRWAPEERSPVTLAPSERRMPNSHEETRVRSGLAFVVRKDCVSHPQKCVSERRGKMVRIVRMCRRICRVTQRETRSCSPRSVGSSLTVRCLSGCSRMYRRGTPRTGTLAWC